MLPYKSLVLGALIGVAAFLASGLLVDSREWLAIIFGAGAVGPPIIGALVSRLFDRLDRTLERASGLNSDYYISVTEAISAYHKQLLDIWLQLIFCCFVIGTSAGIIKYGTNVFTFRISVALGCASLYFIWLLLHNLRKIFLDEVSSRTDMSIKIITESERDKMRVDLGNKLVAGV